MVKAICVVAAEAQTVVARHEPVPSAARTSTLHPPCSAVAQVTNGCIGAGQAAAAAIDTAAVAAAVVAKLRCMHAPFNQ